MLEIRKMQQKHKFERFFTPKKLQNLDPKFTYHIVKYKQAVEYKKLSQSRVGLQEILFVLSDHGRSKE
jgi:hypothetical protein